MKAAKTIYTAWNRWGTATAALCLLLLLSACPVVDEELGAPLPENEFFHFNTDEAIGATPHDIKLVALNADAYPDVIAANRDANTATVLLGSEDGFLPPMPYPTGQSPRMIAVEDFNGDTIPDMAVVNAESDSISVRYGLGDGSFGLPIQLEIPAGAMPVALTAADINDDGGMDLLTANFNTNTVSLWLNHPTQPFHQRTEYNVGTEPNWVAIGDLDKNGDLDIITANSGADDLSILYADGLGGFNPATPLTMATGPQSVCAVDLNDDGKLDLAAACLVTPGLILRIATPTGFGDPVAIPMPAWPVRLLSRDFNDDGLPDLAMSLMKNLGTRAIADKIAIGYGDGLGGFDTIRYFGAGPVAFALAEGALNNDAYPDLVTANFDAGEFTLLYGLEGGGFSTEERFFVGQTPLLLDTLDLNPDMHRDFAVLHDFMEGVELITGSSDGIFDAAGFSDTGISPTSMATADLNDDDIDDLVITGAFTAAIQATYSLTAPSGVAVFISDGAGDFTVKHYYSTIGDANPIDRKPQSVALGDLNGDDAPDMVVGNPKRDTVAIFFNNGNGAFTLQEEFFVANYPLSVRLADLDFDDDLDLVCLSRNDPEVPEDQGSPWLVRYLGAGDGTFIEDSKISYTTRTGPADLLVGDFDDDGYLDAIVSHPSSKMLQIRYGREDGRFGVTDSILVSNTVSKIALADVSRDGLPDILYSANENVIGVLKNKGNRDHTTPIRFPVGDSPTSLCVLDVNQDALLDVLMVNRDSHDISLLRGKLPPVTP